MEDALNMTCVAQNVLLQNAHDNCGDYDNGSDDGGEDDNDGGDVGALNV